MKRNNRIQILSLLTATLMLSACGSGSSNNGSTSLFSNDYSDAFYTNCQVPTGGSFTRSVIGVAKNVATLELDLITTPKGTVEGIGRFNVPSIERLDGLNQGTSNSYDSYFQSYGSLSGTTQPSYDINNTGYSVCVSSVGMPGTLDNETGDLNLALKGPGGLYIEFSSDNNGFDQVNDPVYVHNADLLGAAYLALPGHPTDTLIFGGTGSASAQ